VRGPFLFYRRTPDIGITGAGVGIGAKVGVLGRGAAGPVFLHVSGTFVVPTEAVYEPTEGAVTVPYPAVPFICAIAAELVSASAVAIAIVVSFMILSPAV
jgi:hypothetical protein